MSLRTPFTPLFLKMALPLLVVVFFLKFIFWPNFLTGRPQAEPSASWREVSVGRAWVRAAVAQTPAQVAQGLSGRPHLAEDEGMLFIFSQPGFYSFWMKEMKFPIDIIWVGEDKKVVGFSENLPPASFPQTFSPPVPAPYVLEVNAGWVKERGVLVGDILSTPKGESHCGDSFFEWRCWLLIELGQAFLPKFLDGSVK